MKVPTDSDNKSLCITAKERTYVLEKIIGENDTYTIWEAHRNIITDHYSNNPQKRKYRLYMLKEHFSTDVPSSILCTATDEIRLLSYIYHKNCPYIEDAGEIDIQGGRSLFFAEHWWEGYNIKEIMLLAKHLSTPINKFIIPVGAVLWTIREIADALYHIHTLQDEKGNSLNMVHRNIKPENIYYSKEGRVLLTGFSVSKSNANIFTTMAGQIRGISQYTAPERITSDDLIDGARADIFSLGCVLFEMLMGLPRMRTTNAGLPDVDSLKRKVNMCALRKNIHPRLEKLINKMTMFDPQQRYDSAEEVRDEIDMLLDMPPYRCFISDMEGFVLYMITQNQESYLAVQRLIEREQKIFKEHKNRAKIINPTYSLPSKLTTPKNLHCFSKAVNVKNHFSLASERFTQKEAPPPEEKKNNLSIEQWADIQKRIDNVLQSSKTQGIGKYKSAFIGASIVILIAFLALMIAGFNFYRKNLTASQYSLNNHSINDNIEVKKEVLSSSMNGLLTMEIHVAQNRSLMIQIKFISGIKDEYKHELLQTAYKKISMVDWNPYVGKSITYTFHIIGK